MPPTETRCRKSGQQSVPFRRVVPFGARWSPPHSSKLGGFSPTSQQAGFEGKSTLLLGSLPGIRARPPRLGSCLVRGCQNCSTICDTLRHVVDRYRV
jgi:hypothetical protein